MELTVPGQEIEGRIMRFQKLLSEAQVDAAIVIQNADLFYFSGTVQRGYLIVPASGEPVLAATGPIERIRHESPLKNIHPISGMAELVSLAAQTLGELKGLTLGVEEDVIPVSLYKRLKSSFSESRLKDISGLIRTLRMIKSPYEISLIKDSAQIFSQVMDQLPEILKPGITEVALETELIRIGRRWSHFGPLRVRAFNQEVYYGHVISGPRAAEPSYLMSPTGGLGSCPAFGQGSSFYPIEPHTPIIIDLCFGIQGYLSDQTRTASIGHLPPRLEKGYEALLEIKAKIVEMLRPGTISSTIYEKALELAKESRLSQNFMGYGVTKANFVGHGIGLEIDEWPVIGKGFSTPLAPGMVIALEPKLTFPGVGVIGLEDNYLITEDSPEKLNPLGDKIIVVQP